MATALFPPNSSFVSTKKWGESVCVDTRCSRYDVPVPVGNLDTGTGTGTGTGSCLFPKSEFETTTMYTRSSQLHDCTRLPENGTTLREHRAGANPVAGVTKIQT
jgi:hypothetical protein